MSGKAPGILLLVTEPGVLVIASGITLLVIEPDKLVIAPGILLLVIIPDIEPSIPLLVIVTDILDIELGFICPKDPPGAPRTDPISICSRGPP